MGGYGSGWHRGGRTTVEECLVAPAGKLTEGPRRAAASSWAGNLTWSRNDEVQSRIGFTLWLTGHAGTAHLRYTRTRAADDVEQPVGLTATPLPWGGVRWWFTCPLVVGGRPCGRRVAKLYLPPGGRHFGCRHCYDLTYESAKEAHRFDAMYAQLGRSMGLTGRAVAEQLKAEQRQMERFRNRSGRRERPTPDR